MFCCVASELRVLWQTVSNEEDINYEVFPFFIYISLDPECSFVRLAVAEPNANVNLPSSTVNRMFPGMRFGASFIDDAFASIYYLLEIKNHPLRLVVYKTSTFMTIVN